MGREPERRHSSYYPNLSCNVSRTPSHGSDYAKFRDAMQIRTWCVRFFCLLFVCSLWSSIQWTNKHLKVEQSWSKAMELRSWSLNQAILSVLITIKTYSAIQHIILPISQSDKVDFWNWKVLLFRIFNALFWSRATQGE